jgi:hypothetical protein
MQDETHHLRVQDARAYVRRIQNTRKRTYARLYLDYLLTPTAGEPERGDVSSVAAQAVRVELRRIVGESIT